MCKTEKEGEKLPDPHQSPIPLSANQDTTPLLLLLPLRTNICTDLTPPLFLCGVLAVATRGDDTFCCTPLFDRGRKCTLNLYFFSLCVLCLKGKEDGLTQACETQTRFPLYSRFFRYIPPRDESFSFPPASCLLLGKRCVFSLFLSLFTTEGPDPS